MHLQNPDVASDVTFSLKDLVIYLGFMTLFFKGAQTFVKIDVEETKSVKSQALVNRLASDLFQDVEEMGPGIAIFKFEKAKIGETTEKATINIQRYNVRF